MSRMQRQQQKKQQQQHKRGPDRLVADKDEWDDLPFVRGGAAPPPHLAAKADHHPRAAYPRPQHPPRQQQQQKHPPRLQPPPKQQPRNAPQQRKRSRSSGDPAASISPVGQAVGQSSSSNPGSRLSRAVTVPSYSAHSGPVVVAPTLVAN
ncbi:unnamed protein product, partial [Ectocarpus fasciculatus]